MFLKRSLNRIGTPYKRPQKGEGAQAGMAKSGPCALQRGQRISVRKQFADDRSKAGCFSPPLAACSQIPFFN